MWRLIDTAEHLLVRIFWPSWVSWRSRWSVVVCGAARLYWIAYGTVDDGITTNNHKRGTSEEARGRLGTRFSIPGQLRRGGTMITLAYKTLGISARVVRVVWTRILGLCAAPRVMRLCQTLSHRSESEAVHVDGFLLTVHRLWHLHVATSSVIPDASTLT